MVHVIKECVLSRNIFYAGFFGFGLCIVQFLMCSMNISASDQKEIEGEESSLTVLAPDLIKIMESSILTFHLFLKMDKKKSSGVRNRSGSQTATPLYQIQSSLDKAWFQLRATLHYKLYLSFSRSSVQNIASNPLIQLCLIIDFRICWSR